MCMLRCKHIHDVQSRCGQRSEKAIRSPRTGVKDGCQAPHGHYKLNPGLFQE